MKFCTIRHIDPLNRIHGLKFQFFKAKMADNRHFEKPLNRQNSAAV